MKRMRAFGLCLVISLAFVLVACRKEAPPPAASLLEHEVLGSMPPNTYGFLIFDTAGEAYKRFRATAFGRVGFQVVENLKQTLARGSNQDVSGVLDALMKTRAFNADPAAPPAFKGGAAFLSLAPQANGVEASLCLLGSQGVDVQQDLNTFRASLTGNNSIQDQQYGNAKGFSFQVEPGSSARIFVAVDQNRLVVGSSQELVTTILNQKTPEGLQQTRSSPAYTRAIAALPPTANQMAYGFFDLEVLSSLARKGKLGAGSAQAADDLKDFPVEGVVMARTMTDSLTDNAVITLKAKTEQQKTAFAALNSAGKDVTMEAMPPGTLIFLGFDGRAVSQIKDNALQKAGEAQAAMAASLSVLDSITAMGLGLRPGQGASPFPEVVIAAQSAQADNLRDTIFAQLEGMSSGGGLPVSPWAEKDVAGVKAHFTQSPFGIGAYIASAKDKVILATSEKALADTVETIKGTQMGMVQSLSAATKGLVGQPKSLFAFYSDFTKLADAIGAMQGSLAMFTGGQPPMDQSQLQNLKQLGVLMATVTMDNDMLRVNGAYDPPPAQAAAK